MFELLDWRRVKRELTMLAVCLLVSLLSVGSAFYYKEAQESELTFSQSQLDQANYRAQEARENQLILSDYKPVYDVLVDEGIVGPEDRLSWVESFQRIAEQYLLPMAGYNINKRKKTEVTRFMMGASGISLYESKMLLNLELLHEADLLNLIDQLRTSARGLFTVEECDVKSLKFGDKLSHVYNLQGTCQLNWYTILEDQV